MLNTAITLKIYSDCLNKLGRNSPEFETLSTLTHSLQLTSLE